MGNPFDDATGLVGELRVEYDKLTTELPKLRELNKQLVTDINEGNRKVVEAQEKLDALIEGIKTRTNAYNTWQNEQVREIDNLKAAFNREKLDTENEFAEREAKLKEQHARLDITVNDLTKSAQKIITDQADIEAQRASNSAWAARLGVQEQRLTETDTKLSDAQFKLDKETEELAGRRFKLSEAEKEMADNIKESEQDRKIARQIYNDAKEKIADNDAREDALNIRGKQLDMKEQNLKKIEAGLNDRRNVMIANGTLS